MSVYFVLLRETPSFRSAGLKPKARNDDFYTDDWWARIVFASFHRAGSPFNSVVFRYRALFKDKAADPTEAKLSWEFSQLTSIWLQYLTLQPT
jgi:hypothetical protein